MITVNEERKRKMGLEEQARILELIAANRAAIRYGGDQLVKEFGFESINAWAAAKINEYAEAGGNPSYLYGVLQDVLRATPDVLHVQHVQPAPDPVPGPAPDEPRLPDHIIDRVEPGDVTPELKALAEQWARRYVGTFKWMQEMKTVVEVAGSLSFKQAAGVINCWLHDLRRTPAPRPRYGQPPYAKFVRKAVPDLQPGPYMHDGQVYRVRRRKSSGKVYAEKLQVVEGKGYFTYAAGVVRYIRPEEQITFEQAKEFGANYGICCNCGATLTNDKSIELGIGPVCRKRLRG